MHRGSLLIAALAVAAVASGCSRQEPLTAPDASAALRTAVSNKAPSFAIEDSDRGHHVWREAQRFYKQNGYQLAWVSGSRPRPQLDALIRGLRAADSEGLNAADYRVADLE